jgi:hypothetical protein
MGFRFQPPLIEPGIGISRSRLPDQTSSVRPRETPSKGCRLHEPQACVEVLVREAGVAAIVARQYNDSRVVPFLRVELLELLSTSRPIDCICAACNQIWPITQIERAAVQRELDS